MEQCTRPEPIEPRFARIPVSPTNTTPSTPSTPPTPEQIALVDKLHRRDLEDGFGEVYTDFAIHADGFSRIVLLAGAMTPRRLGRLVQRLLEIETYRMAALLGLPAAREVSEPRANGSGSVCTVAVTWLRPL